MTSSPPCAWSWRFQAVDARRARDDLVAQSDDYLLPRLRQMDAPVLMVVGGSTGAGKSTLVNSLVGSVVSPAGVLRPTTRAPVLACHPDDLRWFEDDRILPHLPDDRRRCAPDAPARSRADAPQGLALLDSPDIDSVLAENRALANQLLTAADGWLFVTTALRYADAVPWEFLRAARDRGTAMSVVLNRVPADAEREVTSHMSEMMRTQGLDADLLVVRVPLEDGLPRRALEPVRRWLDGLAADAQARGDLIRRTLSGALASLPPARYGRTGRRRTARRRRRAPGRDRPGIRRGTARDRGRPAERLLLRGEVSHAGTTSSEPVTSCGRCRPASDRPGTVEEHPHRQAGRRRGAAVAVEHRLEAVIQAATASGRRSAFRARGVSTSPARRCSTPRPSSVGAAERRGDGGGGTRLAGLRHGARAP